jgi:hypothetical protein
MGRIRAARGRASLGGRAEPGDADPGVAARVTFEAEMSQVVKGFLTIRDEDVAICRAVQEGLSSRFAEPGRLCHLEKAIWQFARYVAARVGDGVR